jgi:predicted lipoprotein with Yx(FWY)xxD motif
MSVRFRTGRLVGAALAVTAAAVLMGCSGSSTATATPTATVALKAAATSTPAAAATVAATSTPAATAAATGTAAAAATIKVAQVSGANALVEAKGLTLYLFKNDTAGSGKSACAGGCATTWPPLTATGTPTKAAGISGDLGTITRDDGTTQVTYKGQPLYRFAADTAAGDAKGAAINNWSVAIP